MVAFIVGQLTSVGWLITVLWIGIGGFLGANARFFMGRAIVERYGFTFPWATLSINVLGSFLIGVALDVITRKYVDESGYRLLIVVGFLGGFTTFSTFAFETAQLIQEQRLLRAASYVISSNVLAIVACVLGLYLSRRFGPI